MLGTQRGGPDRHGALRCDTGLPAGSKEESDNSKFRAVDGGVQGAGEHARGEIDGRAEVNVLDEAPVCEHPGIGIRTMLQSEGSGVEAAVVDGPEEDGHCGGGGQEVWGEDGVQKAVRAGECREMAGEVVAEARRVSEKEGGNDTKQLVREAK